MTSRKVKGYSRFANSTKHHISLIPLKAKEIAGIIQDVLVRTSWEYGSPLPEKKVFLEEFEKHIQAVALFCPLRETVVRILDYVPELAESPRFIEQVKERQLREVKPRTFADLDKKFRRPTDDPNPGFDDDYMSGRLALEKLTGLLAEWCDKLDVPTSSLEEPFFRYEQSSGPLPASVVQEHTADYMNGAYSAFEGTLSYRTLRFLAVKAMIIGGGDVEYMVKFIAERMGETWTGLTALFVRKVMRSVIPEVAAALYGNYPIGVNVTKQMVEAMISRLLFDDKDTANTDSARIAIDTRTIINKFGLPNTPEVVRVLADLAIHLRTHYNLLKDTHDMTDEVKTSDKDDRPTLRDIGGLNVNFDTESPLGKVEPFTDPTAESVRQFMCSAPGIELILDLEPKHKSYLEESGRRAEELEKQKRLDRILLEFEQVAINAVIEGIPTVTLEHVLVSTAPSSLTSVELLALLEHATEVYAERRIKYRLFDEFTYAMFDEISLIDLARDFNMDINEVHDRYTDWQQRCRVWADTVRVDLRNHSSDTDSE